MSTHEQRGIRALERIAIALERQAESDPLLALGAIMQGDDSPAVESPTGPAQVHRDGKGVLVARYQHPEPGWVIVLVRDSASESGYDVRQERG